MTQQVIDTVGATDDIASGGNKINANFEEIYLHKNSTTNPHAVTATQVGLGNVDNTSDMNKPVSTLQQTAIDLNPQVRMNPSIVSADLSIPDNYNAYAAGPLEVATGVTITIGANATLNII